jgi:hypothetical protein
LKEEENGWISQGNGLREKEKASLGSGQGVGTPHVLVGVVGVERDATSSQLGPEQEFLLHNYLCTVDEWKKNMAKI